VEKVVFRLLMTKEIASQHQELQFLLLSLVKILKFLVFAAIVGRL